MHYLTNYYKNLCEQLQERLNFLENLLEDTTFGGEEFPERPDPNKRIVRPSPLSHDAAARFLDLSPDYAAFQELATQGGAGMTDQEIVDVYTKFPPKADSSKFKDLEAAFRAIDKEYEIGSKENISRKAERIISSIAADKVMRDAPDIFLDDQTQLRGRKPKLTTLAQMAWWDNLSTKGKNIMTLPDLRGVFQPDPKSPDFTYSEVKVPADSEIRVRPSMRSGEFSPKPTIIKMGDPGYVQGLLQKRPELKYASTEKYPVPTEKITQTMQPLSMKPSGAAVSRVVDRMARGRGGRYAAGAALTALGLKVLDATLGQDMQPGVVSGPASQADYDKAAKEARERRRAKGHLEKDLEAIYNPMREQ